MKVPLADVRVSEEDIAAIADTYRSGWLSTGPRTKEFETAFAEYVGVPHAIAVANCTAALHLLCLASGLGPGDEVIVPSMTFVATANAVKYCGATPVFADIAGPTEPWLSARGIEAVITPKTKAILYVAYGGHPGEALAVQALAERRGLIFLQDAAHAIGTRIGDVQLGSLGLGSAYSFFSNKNLAIGEGGMVTTADDGFAAKVRLLRSHGMTTLSWDRHRGHASGYDVVELGFNYRMDEARATFGARRLAALDAENDQRRALDARYRELLAGVVDCTSIPLENTSGAHHIFTVTLAPDSDRTAVREKLTEQGVQTSVHYPPVHRFSIHQRDEVELPLTDEYAQRTLTLPLFPHMSEEQQDLVVASLRNATA